MKRQMSKKLILCSRVRAPSYVRYIGQHANLATFSLQSYSYPAGAAHGIHHQEFVTFDLKQKKRLALQDIMLPNSEAKMINCLTIIIIG